MRLFRRPAVPATPAPAETQPAVPARPWENAYDPVAREDDILACFRLILGRMPNAEEWHGHAQRRGEPLGRIVASYLNSMEFARRGLLEQDHLADVVLTELPAFRIHTSRGDNAIGHSVRHDAYEPEVAAVFRRFLRPGMGVIDVGANVGYFTLLAATLVGASGMVLAIEPNPLNARLLEASRRANGFDHITISQTAAGRATGLLVLNTFLSNGTTSAPPTDANALLGSTTVPCVRIDALVPEGRSIDFIKIDVEGAEYAALQGASATIARSRPVIVSEFTPNAMPDLSGIDGPGYLRWLIGLGYELAVIGAEGALAPFGTDWAAVMRAKETSGVEHVDIVATPVSLPSASP